MRKKTPTELHTGAIYQLRRSSPIVVCLLLLVLIVSSACSPTRAAVSSENRREEDAQRLVVRGQRLAASGQSVRAEQYFLASIEAGAPEEVVLPELIDTCVVSGRLRSALDYVERASKLEPEDVRLQRLLATIYLSLGQVDLAAQVVEQLARQSEPSPETLLFLAESYDRYLSQRGRAVEFYGRYLAAVPEGIAPSWVFFALRRLEESEERAFSQLSFGTQFEQEAPEGNHDDRVKN